MLQSANHLRLENSVEIPAHFDEFTEVSTSLLRHAHTQGLDRDLATVRLSSDPEATRLYVESQHERHVDREHLGVHLAKSGQWLMVSFQTPMEFSQTGGFSQPRSTVVIEQAGVHVHHTGIGGRLSEARLDDNEIAGKYFTDRLYRSLGYFGIYSQSELEQLRQAS